MMLVFFSLSHVKWKVTQTFQSKVPRHSKTPFSGVWEWDEQSGNEMNCLLVTLIFLSLMESLKSGRDSRETIQVCPSTWAAVHRCMGSTCNMRRTRSLAEGEIESQFPPERLILPSPIRDKICWGVSSGPVAKGVQLKEEGSQCIMLGQLLMVSTRAGPLPEGNHANEAVLQPTFYFDLCSSHL